jgi:hypothetical protein
MGQGNGEAGLPLHRPTLLLRAGVMASLVIESPWRRGKERMASANSLPDKVPAEIPWAWWTRFSMALSGIHTAMRTVSISRSTTAS